MEIRWRFDGDSMEIPWRFDGDSMERPWSTPRPPDHQSDHHFDTFSTHFSASVLKHKNDSPKWSWKLPGEVKQRFYASEGSILMSRDIQTGSQDLQVTLGGSWGNPGTASDHRKRYQNDQYHENHWKWNHMARFELRIRLFASHSHFPSIANPPRPQHPP